MNLSTFDMLRVWAALTGLVLAVVYFVQIGLGYEGSQSVMMLAAGIGGFEMFLFAQDKWLQRGGQHG